MSRHAKRKSSKPKRPKTKLGLPDLDHSKSAVLDSLRSPESKRGYRHAIDEFIQWYCSEPRLSFNKVVVARFHIFLENRQLAAGTINGRLAAVRGSPTRPQTLACSVRNSPPVSACERCQETGSEAWELAHGPELEVSTAKCIAIRSSQSL